MLRRALRLGPHLRMNVAVGQRTFKLPMVSPPPAKSKQSPISACASPASKAGRVTRWGQHPP